MRPLPQPHDHGIARVCVRRTILRQRMPRQVRLVHEDAQSQSQSPAAAAGARVKVPICERLAEGPAHVHSLLRPGPGVRVRRRTELEKPSKGPAGTRGLKGAAAAAAAFEAATSLKPPVSPGSGAVGVVVATPGLASRIHNTHNAAEHRGALWCWKCGGWSNSARRGTVRTAALVQQCRMPTPSGKAVLSRLRRMLPPDSKSRGIWPEDVPRAYAG